MPQAPGKRAVDRANGEVAKCQQTSSSVKSYGEEEEAAMLAALPSMDALRVWVERPQSVTKCTVADLYAMRGLVQSNGQFRPRAPDVFMLDQYPCRMVELVGWVASVDDKIDRLMITLDDGDGENLVGINLRLQVHRPSAPSKSKHTLTLTATTNPISTSQARLLPPVAPNAKGAKVPDSCFLGKKQREIRDAKLARDAARLAQAEARGRADQEESEAAAKKAEAEARARHRARGRRPVVAYEPHLSETYKGNRYLRRDVRVGDTVRVVARLEEYERRRASGIEVVRVLWCDEASGGRFEVVHPDEHFIHQSQIRQVRESLYSKPFVLPTNTHQAMAPTAQAPSPARACIPELEIDSRCGPCTPNKRICTPSTRRELASPCRTPSAQARKQPQSGIQEELQLQARTDASVSTSGAYSFSDSLDLDSTVYSELNSFADHSLPDVSSLRSSQLTEATYRRYLLDYMIGQVTEAIDSLTRRGEGVLEAALHAVFPEYHVDPLRRMRPDLSCAATPPAPGRFLPSRSRGQTETPLREIQSGVISHTFRRKATILSDNEATPKAKSKASRTYASSSLQQTNEASSYSSLFADSSIDLSQESDIPIPAFTLDALVAVPHLATLGGLIADATAKSNERRRRRRIKEGQATEKDRAVERDRLAKGRRADEYHLSDRERRKEVLKMTMRALRSISEDGGVVQVASASNSGNGFGIPGALGRADTQYSAYDISTSTTASTVAMMMARTEGAAYIPVTPPLILPLLRRFIDEETTRRTKVILRKTDPRFGHGVLVPDLARKLAAFGQEGRWERIGEWNVEDAVLWGVDRGLVWKQGEGYWNVHSDARGM